MLTKLPEYNILTFNICAQSCILNALTQQINFVQWELKQRHSASCETEAFLQARRLLFMMSGMPAFSFLRLTIDKQWHAQKSWLSLHDHWGTCCTCPKMHNWQRTSKWLMLLSSLKFLKILVIVPGLIIYYFCNRLHVKLYER